MDWGLLWYDDTANRSLADKVVRAAAHFEKKYGRPPTICFVNPAANAERGADRVSGIQIETLKIVMPNCLWIGVGETRRGARRKS